MNRPLKTFLILAAMLVVTIVLMAPASASSHDPLLINEFLANHSGTDDTEYVELYGNPGDSLQGLSLIVVEGDAFNPGNIDRRFDFKPFHEIGANGFFLFGNCAGLADNYSEVPDASLFNNYFENSSLTLALAETSSVGEQDTTVTGDEVILSAIALKDEDADEDGDEFFFDAPVLGPVPFNGGFDFPAGARRLEDGVDTGTVADWEFADFVLPGDNTPTGGGFDGCAPLELTIPEIQGDGRFSPYQGEVVTTEGVITLITANGRDMWIQDVEGDGDPATSDGIFVDDANRLGFIPMIGDLIRITGDAEEQQFGNALPLTRIDRPGDGYIVELLSSGNPLPDPVPLVDLPNWAIPDGEAFWEPLEGMRVSIRNGFVVAATNGFGEFGMLTEEDADADMDSGYFAQIKQILIQSLGMVDDDYIVDYNPERIMVDDSTLEDPINVAAGDRVRQLTGVVDYTFSMYKLQPDTFDVKNHNTPKMPVSKRSGGFGNFAITTYNIENLFDLIDNPDKDDEGSTPTPEELEIQLAKLALSIEVELDLPEIIVVQETENEEILQELGDIVNESNGTAYKAVSFETSDGRGIEVGFLYDMYRATLVDAYQMSGPGVEMWFGPTSPSPGREPLVGVFNIMNHEVTIIGNHFKSKGGDDPLYGVNWPPVRTTEVQRKGQARVVRDFVNDILDEDPDAMVMVAGDLNDFQFSEPGEGPDNPVAIVAGGPEEVPLINLATLEKPAETFSFVFDGNSQLLDHILVSPGLFEYFKAADILHFNNVAPTPLFDEDTSTTLEASDHDPVESRFFFK
jgi:predicted extracellular nuclease